MEQLSNYNAAPLPQGASDKGQVMLRDGSTARLKLVEANDKELLEAFVKRLVKDAMHHRFFGETSQELVVQQYIKERHA